MTNSSFSPTDLRELQRQLTTWRRQQSGHPLLPEAVWASAAALAQRHGASLVARTLHLDYCKLRQRSAGCPPPAEGAAAFVELQVAPTQAPASGEATVELADGTGARMTLRVRSELPTVVALAESFWRRPR